MTRIRHLNHRKALLASAIVFATALSGASYAQEDQFKKADQILERISKMTPSDSSAPTQEKNTPKAEATPAPMNENLNIKEYASTEVEQPVPVVKNMENSVLETRLSEVPPNTRLEFAQSLRVPAYKKGILFVNGKPSFAINNDASPLAVMSKEDINYTVCVLLSNRSHIQMRGSNNSEGKEPTFLSVDSVKFMRHSVDSKTFNTADIYFKSKDAKGIAGNEVSISVSCRISDDIKNPPAEYRLKHFSDALGDLFNYRLPRYIEI